MCYSLCNYCCCFLSTKFHLWVYLWQCKAHLVFRAVNAEKSCSQRYVVGKERIWYSGAFVVWVKLPDIWTRSQLLVRLQAMFWLLNVLKLNKFFSQTNFHIWFWKKPFRKGKVLCLPQAMKKKMVSNIPRWPMMFSHMRNLPHWSSHQVEESLPCNS